jgi:hypothetical protein
MPVKVGLLVITGGGIITGAWYVLARLPRRISMIVIIGFAVVALLVMLYVRFLKRIRKRKAAPMEQGIMENTSAAPQGVSEPARMARLDDLRKRFESGVEKYRAAGKNLYDFPWYLVVGEPGSGKTEAIRHCNVGFPPGLQDQLQGTGGTVNMNWWFTDYAVILDTAGRLMFEEVEAGGSSEWNEFLSLLKRYRPNCPVNGIFLVIPSDSLIKDTADEIEQKASKIARQFDVIQRTLDVRFPVFVIISKSDLIHGFRDFFENIEDPQLQHQIMGWSNPTPLDEPYSTDFIDRHLKAIRERLFRRRLALMQQIMTTDNDMGQEMRQVDALYAFPQSLFKMAPRMARYLELIFSVGTQWSCKPVFFRGIYFTSSMQEGSALDMELAESLGVPIDSLPDGRAWKRDRAYFLRDLFIKKVFREKGLVTRATNAKKMYTRRKAVVLFTAIASVLLLLSFTVYAAIRWERSIGGLKEYLTHASEGMPQLSGLKVIKFESGDRYIPIGNAEVKLSSGKKVRRNQFYARLADMVDRWKEKGVPWVFAPAARFAGSIRAERLNKAQAIVYEKGVLEPFLRAASIRMKLQKNGEWKLDQADPDSEAALKVLHELLCIRAKQPLREYVLVDGQEQEVTYSADTFLDPLFRYVFGSEDNYENRLQNYNEHKTELHKPLGRVYGDIDKDKFRVAWPPTAFLKTSQDPADTVYNPTITYGVELFNKYWSDPNIVDTEHEDQFDIKAIRKIAAALERFDAVEQDMLSIYDAESEKSFDDRKQETLISKWREYSEELRDIIKDIDDSSLKTVSLLQARWEEAARKASLEIDNNYDFLLKELDDIEEDDEFLCGIQNKLEMTRGELKNRLEDKEFKAKLAELDKRFYSRVRNDTEKRRLYEIRYGMYKRAYDQLGVLEEPIRIEMIAKLIKRIKDNVEEARETVRELRGLQQLDENEHAAEDSLFALKVAERKRLANIAEMCLDELMTKYSKKFPLAKSGTQNLAGKELTEVQNLLLGIEEIQKLLQIRLLEDKNLARILKVLRGLPGGSSPYYCKMVLLNPADQDDSINYLRVVRISQGSKTGDRYRTSSGEDLFVAQYPGKPIKVGFYRYLDDTNPTAKREFEGPWACLKMMHEDSDAQEKRFIRIKLKAEYEGTDPVLKSQDLVLNLKLQFYKDPGCEEEVVLPMAEDWP